MRLHYIWVSHLPTEVHRDDLWSICIKYGFVKDLFLMEFGSAIVCYEDKEDGMSAEEGLAEELFQKYGVWCPVTKSEWGCCFTVEVSPVPPDNPIHHLLYSIFRPCGPILSIQVHKASGKALVSFSQLSGGLKAMTRQTELFGEILHVIPHGSVEQFRHKILLISAKRAILPQGEAAAELVEMMEKLVQVEEYDAVSDMFHLFGSKVEVAWALDRINSREELNIISSSSPGELVELNISKISNDAGMEEVEQLFNQFGVVVEIIKDESIQDQRFYNCSMVVSCSLLEFSLGDVPTMRRGLVLRGSTLKVSHIIFPQPNLNSTTANKEDSSNAPTTTEALKIDHSYSTATNEKKESKNPPKTTEKLNIDLSYSTVTKKESVNPPKKTEKHKIGNKTRRVSSQMYNNFVKLFISGEDSTSREKIAAILKKLGVVADLWIPSSGYSFVGVNLFPGVHVSSVLSLSNELLTFRLALDQSMDIPPYYDHPISQRGWMCAKPRCDTHNTGLYCTKCGLECTGGNCRAAIQQAHGVVTKIFNKSRGIVAFMEPGTGKEDYAYFYRGNLDLNSSSKEFKNLEGKYIVFNATATGEWEELAMDIWICWVATSATLAPYNPQEVQSVSLPKEIKIEGAIATESITNMVSNLHNDVTHEEIASSTLDWASEPQNLFLWPTFVESVTSFWAKDLDEVDLLTRLEEVHDACLMREALDKVPEPGGIYGGLMFSTDRFYRVKVIRFDHIHSIEVFYVDEGSSSSLSLNMMRPLPLHLTSLPSAGRKYELAGCSPVSQDESLVYGNFYQGREWLRKLLLGEEVRATGLLAGGRFLVDCIAASLHVNTEVLDRGFTNQVLQLPHNFQEIV